LTQYAFETRYPGAFEPVTEEDYQEAVQVAEVVVEWAESVINGGNNS
jgi:HEPN domain-containing protein